MTAIRHYGFVNNARVEASSFLAVYRNGKLRRSGRGLAVWYGPASSTSLMEVPADDRDHIIQISATTRDFQTVSVQGVATWRAAEPITLAERIDFSVDPRHGVYRADPIAQIESLIDSLLKVVVERYVASRTVGDVLEAGVGPLLKETEADATAAARLASIGVELVGVRLSSLTPPPELARALRQPTMEKLQQAADEATLARRAAAVEKEAVIAENETKAKIRLEQERSELIARQRDNTLAQARAESEAAQITAEGEAETRRIGAQAEAEAIVALDEARLAGERARAEIARTMPPVVVMSEALKEGLAASKIGTLNLGPDIVSLLGSAFRQGAAQQPVA